MSAIAVGIGCRLPGYIVSLSAAESVRSGHVAGFGGSGRTGELTSPRLPTHAALPAIHVVAASDHRESRCHLALQRESRPLTFRLRPRITRVLRLLISLEADAGIRLPAGDATTVLALADRLSGAMQELQLAEAVGHD